GDEARRCDVLEAPDGPGAPRGAVHAARVELHHAVGIGQAAETNRLVLGVELLDVDTGDDRVERVLAGDDLVVRNLHAANAVGGRHHDGPRTGGNARQGGVRWACVGSGE